MCVSLSVRRAGRHGAVRFDGFERLVIQPLLPNRMRCVKRRDVRQGLNGLFWRLRTGAPQVGNPARHGAYMTCMNRLADGGGRAL